MIGDLSSFTEVSNVLALGLNTVPEVTSKNRGGREWPSRRHSRPHPFSYHLEERIHNHARSVATPDHAQLYGW